MNKTEAAYAVLLEDMKSAGEIQWWAYEAIKLRLADKTYYTPDFAVINGQEELEFHEVKGFWREDARVKIKAANEQFPFLFIAFTLVKGTWQEEEFKKHHG
jgi:hypothetical protein